MKKIGILTTSVNASGTYGCNYGAALQGYALVRQIRDLGYKAYDINYLSDYEYHPKQYNIFKRTLLRIPLLFNTKLVKQKIFEYKTRKERALLRSKFVEFVKETDLTYNKGKFYKIEDLKKISDSFYAFVTGSDVVWNPNLKKGVNDPGYFLQFAEKKSKRIAYAPSFGITKLPQTSLCNLKDYLETFDAISVREKSGCKLVKKHTGLDAKLVLDPTLLLSPEKYDDITKVPDGLPKKYIAVYRFGNIEHTIEKIKEISKKLKLPIVYIPSNNDGVFKTDYNIGPSEFLGVIKNAELVLSDSFHCTVFALINHKPFLTFYRSMPKPGQDLNSRMSDLLDLVGLNDRLVKPNENIDYDCLLKIDFAHADSVINTMRKDSLNYLKTALEGK